jgi:hypothetical protein
MKLNSLKINQIEGFEFKNLDSIIGGAGTCKGTCCTNPNDATDCEDWEPDCPNQQ